MSGFKLYMLGGAAALAVGAPVLLNVGAENNQKAAQAAVLKLSRADNSGVILPAFEEYKKSLGDNRFDTAECVSFVCQELQNNQKEGKPLLELRNGSETITFGNTQEAAKFLQNELAYKLPERQR